MNLKDVSQSDSPFGKLDATDPSSYGKVAAVSFVILAGAAGANFAFNKLKSTAGADGFNIPTSGDF